VIDSRPPVQLLITVFQAIHQSECWISTPSNHLSTEILFRELSILQKLIGSIQTAFTSRCGCFATGTRPTRITLNSATDHSRYAASHRDANLTRDTFCTSDHASFADLTACGVRNFAGANLLFHAACRVRNLLCAALCHHSASRVGNATSNALFRPRAGRVRNLASAGLLNHCAGGVRNLFRAGFLNERAGRVRNFFHTGHWHLSANGVWNLLVADFRNHASTGNRLLHSFGNPLAAANRPGWALDTHLFAATGIAGITNTFFNNRTGDDAGFCHPFATADINRSAFSHRLADRVAHVLVAGFRLRPVGRHADVLVAGLVHGLADVVADRAVAGLIHRFADSVGTIAVASLVARLAHATGHIAVANLIHRLAHRVSAGSIAGLVDRLADRVALVTVACFIDVLRTCDRDGFGALIVHRLHAGILLRLPDHFLNCVALRATSAPSCDKITAC